MRRNAISAAAREEESEINLTPMLDVVFIMLIFFIVTANFCCHLPSSTIRAVSSPDAKH